MFTSHAIPSDGIYISWHLHRMTFTSHAIPSDGEMQAVYAKLNACKIKAVALSLLDTYADQFIDESRTLPIIPDLFETGNLELEYPELIKMCVEVTLGVSEEHIKKHMSKIDPLKVSAGY